MNTLSYIFSSFRLRDWIGNLFVFIPLVLAGLIFDYGLFLKAAEAFLLFSLSAGAVSILNDVLDIADMILIMTVHPGFGGQSFIKDCLPKIEKIKEMFDGDLEVDGGINYETAQLAIKAGINMVVAGTHLFSSHDMKKDIENIKCLKR